MVVPKEIIEDICKNTYGISLQTASCYEIIENHILPIYQEGAWKSKVNQLLGYICYIKDNLSQYEKESNEKNNSDSLSSLKASLLIKTDENRYLRPADVYLPASYGNPNDLETLLSGIQDVWFVSSELGDSVSYLDITLNNLDFIKDLGIKNNITDPKYSAD